MGILVVFFFKIFEFILGAMFRSLFSRRTYRNNFRALSNMDKVKYLERIRQYKGYKKRWLYFRCKEKGLLKEYNHLFKINETEQQETKTMIYKNGVEFSFGKYKGKAIKEVWKYDKSYIKWVYQNVNFDDYPFEEMVIEKLVNAD